MCILGRCFHQNSAGGTYSSHSLPDTFTLTKRKDEHENYCVIFFFKTTTKILIWSYAHYFGHMLTGSHRSYIKNMSTLHVLGLWFVARLALQLDPGPCPLLPIQLNIKCQEAPQLSCFWSGPEVCPNLWFSVCHNVLGFLEELLCSLASPVPYL